MEKLSIALIFLLIVAAVYNLLMLNVEVNEFLEQREKRTEICITQHNTADYKYVNNTLYCKTEDGFIETQEK